MITGGSGFLGRALTKHWRDEHTVCVYSRGEAAQMALEPHINVRPLIGDVRDYRRLRRAMQRCDVVVHAAALKHIYIGRVNPIEMALTNVLGTINVVEAAQDAGVDRVLFVSTDKAWRPVSAYGRSKAYGEDLVLSANDTVPHHKPRFSAVRYGNVMGSTGSVIPIWRKQLAQKGRVTITDPEVTRFWMSVDEAVALIDRTIETMPSEIAIPTLPAFRLGDLAAAMGAGYDVTALPEWEKVHEGMSDMNRSDNARRMSVDEIRERLKEVE